MNRLLHLAGLASLALLFTIFLLGIPAWTVFIAGSVWLTGMLLLGRGRLPLWLYAVAVAVCFIAGRLWLFQIFRVEPQNELAGQTIEVKAEVVDREISGNGKKLSLKLQGSDTTPFLAGKRVRLWVPSGIDLRVGDLFSSTLKLTCDPSDQTRLYAEGYAYAAFLYYQPKIMGRSQSLSVKFSQYREGMRENLVRLLPNGEGELLAAMLTGKTGGLSLETRDIYARAGISHLLAVSGLHLSILTVLFGAFLRLFFVSRRKIVITQMLLVVLFISLTGFPPSILRAGIMLLLGNIAFLTGREADSLNSLGAAILLILMANPYAAMDIGLQLSYLATMGIIIFTDPLSSLFCKLIWNMQLHQARKKYPKPTALISCVSVTIGAGILTTPLVCFYFGQFSFISIPVNLIIIPFATAALGSGLVCAVVGFWHAALPIYKLSGLIAGVFAGCIDRVARFTGQWQFAAVSVKNESTLIWMAAVLLLGIIFWRVKAGWKAAIWSAQLCACVLILSLLSQRVVVKDMVQVSAVSGGEAVVLCYGRQAAIVGAPENLNATFYLKKQLKDFGVVSIDLLIVEKEEQLSSSSVKSLSDFFPIENMVSLDQVESFHFILYENKINIFYDNQSGEAVCLKIGEFQVVKAFSMDWYSGDILINQRNEIILSKDLSLSVDQRYYNASVLRLYAMPNCQEEQKQ